MSPYASGRLWSLPLVALAVLLSMMGFPSMAQAADVITSENKYFELTYDCLEGQTLTLDPGQFRVALKDEAGNTVGYDEIVSAGIDVFPVVQFSPEGRRTQVQWYPGTITTFQPESGLPLNGNKKVWIKTALEWSNQAGVPEYLPGTVTCVGGATDTDHDGIPDELDKCSSVAVSGSSDGCPEGAVLKLVSAEGGHSQDGDTGSATFTVMNPADGGGAESYFLEVGTQNATTPQLADGETSVPMSFELLPGTDAACATSDVSRKTSCITFTVPDSTQPANAGTVTFVRTCRGLNYTVKNTGWKTSVYNVLITAPAQASRYYSWRLAPGESRSGVSPSYWYGLAVKVTMLNEFGAEASNPYVGGQRWTQPAGCTPPMFGGDRLISWGKVTRTVAVPKVTIHTRAYHAHYGYQIKGRGVVWFAGARPGTHTFSLLTMRVPRHAQRTVRLWVEYKGADAGVVFGAHAFTGWHVYKRP